METATATAIPTTHSNKFKLSNMLENAERQKSERERLEQFIFTNLTEGIDYGTIPGTRKPTLYKPGAEKLLGYAGLKPIHFVDRETMEFIKSEDTIVYICRLIDKEDVVYAEGRGACTLTEGKKTKDWNALVKMAQKRGMIDATLTCFGISDRFTQDVEDIKALLSFNPHKEKVGFGRDKDKFWIELPVTELERLQSVMSRDEIQSKIKATLLEKSKTNGSAITTNSNGSPASKPVNGTAVKTNNGVSKPINGNGTAPRVETKPVQTAPKPEAKKETPAVEFDPNKEIWQVGKHKGKTYINLPQDYIIYVIENFKVDDPARLNIIKTQEYIKQLELSASAPVNNPSDLFLEYVKQLNRAKLTEEFQTVANAIREDKHKLTPDEITKLQVIYKSKSRGSKTAGDVADDIHERRKANQSKYGYRK